MLDHVLVLFFYKRFLLLHLYDICVSDLQESPTGELADYTFPTGTLEPSSEDSPEGEDSNQHPQPDPELEAQPQGTCNVSDDVDGDNSEEGKSVKYIYNPLHEQY